MTVIIEFAKKLYSLEDFVFTPVPGHEGGRNQIVIISRNGDKQYVLRISALGDRTVNDYLAETEFVRFLAENDGPVANVIPSVNGKLVEQIEIDGKVIYAGLFAYAKGILIADNGYRYREGASLSEYFFNTGKALGKIHRLSKTYTPVHNRPDYFDKYNMAYIDRLIPNEYIDLKSAIEKRLDSFQTLPKNKDCYGMIHFDFSDGNYHIDMDTGLITVFDLQLQGYKTETELPEEMLKKLPLFIDMVLIENIADEFECCAREGEAPDYEDIEDAAECLIHGIPYAGIRQQY